MAQSRRQDQAALVFIVGVGVGTVISVAAVIGVSPRDNLWWDGITLAQLQVITGVAGAALALMAIIYAWRVATRQFDMLDEQGEIVEKQLAMMKEQNAISFGIEKVSREQVEIIATQHAI